MKSKIREKNDCVARERFRNAFWSVFSLMQGFSVWEGKKNLRQFLGISCRAFKQLTPLLGREFPASPHGCSAGLPSGGEVHLRAAHAACGVRWMSPSWGKNKTGQEQTFSRATHTPRHRFLFERFARTKSYIEVPALLRNRHKGPRSGSLSNPTFLKTSTHFLEPKAVHAFPAPSRKSAKNCPSVEICDQITFSCSKDN